MITLNPVTPTSHLIISQSENWTQADHRPCDPQPPLDFKSALPKPFGELLVAQTVKNLWAMQETLVRSLGQEDPLEREW